jgi:hypothetical protein
MVNMNEWLTTGEMLKREAPITAERYPRILERIQYLWSEPQDCRLCFRNLLMKDSLERQGFPVEVVGELMHLNKRYERSHPQPESLEMVSDDYLIYRG